MQKRTRAAESNRESAPVRGAERSAPRTTPLTLVSGAIAGDDLEQVTTAVAAALRRPIAVAIPALGGPVVRPVGALSAELSDAVHLHATARVAGVRMSLPEGVQDAVSIQIGDQVVGIVTATSVQNGSSVSVAPAELRAWLEAAAAAASINALIRETQGRMRARDGAALLVELIAGVPDDFAGFLARARRAGFELNGGGAAIAIRVNVTRIGDVDPAAQPPAPALTEVAAKLAEHDAVLAALTAPGRLLALVPANAGVDAGALAAGLRTPGLDVVMSAMRRDPTALTEALREVGLLLALPEVGVPAGSHDETYRLLIGVLLRDPEELLALRERTVAPLADYDARHDTDLLVTLQTFLAQDGSTTETADAMSLHRHTVGYRLARVHEVSGLSPYESDGRERLSLGLKAHQILEADARARL